MAPRSAPPRRTSFDLLHCNEDDMINPDEPAHIPDDRMVERIVAEGPRGAVVVAGIATAAVVAMWVLFYLLVFVPRSV